MSFTRLRYDDGAYRHDLRQSVGQHDYVCNTPVETTGCAGACVPARAIGKATSGLYAGQASEWPSLVGIESELSGITRKISNNPTEKYIPGNSTNLPTHPRVVSTCDSMGIGKHLENEDTRMSNPPVTLRGTGWNRFEWPLENPQHHAIMPFDTNISNRIVAKDNHRPLLQIPEDQRAVLPPPPPPLSHSFSDEDDSCSQREWTHEPSTAWKPWDKWC